MAGVPELEISWIEHLKTIDTPTVSNAIESFGVRPRSEGFAPLQIRCFFPELGRMCGYAVTAQLETVTQSNREDRGMFMRLFEAVRESPKPAVLAFQDIGCYEDRAAHCGEVLATVFSRLGAVGLVTDCGVRDVPEVRALGFHYFARGAVASHANFRIIRVGVPIQILGLAVQQGDILHGDENGLLSVPGECITNLLQSVETVRSNERRLLEFVRGPNFSLSELKSYFVE